ncbi:hypothetical protein C0389_06895 [bacterium]|nr:hypothetical protein [bacterium]
MKRIFVFCLFILFAVPVMINAGEIIVRNYEITAGTQTSVLGVGYIPGRKYLLIVNSNSLYDVRMTTYPITAGVNSGIPIYNTGGYFEDSFYVYKSSWYFISTGAGSSSISILEKE